MSASGERRWLVSAPFDLGWFVVPSLAALVVGAAVGLATRPRDDDSLALWIVGVVLVDVAHVWASLYRTYLDPRARKAHAELLRATPLVVFALAFILHAISARVFWGALAYVAVFHFIKQQEGFTALYLRAGGERGPESAGDHRLTKLAVWAGTAGPVLWWHAQLPRRFAWFMADDFIAGLPTVVGAVAVWAQVPILAVFFARRIQLARRGQGHPMVALIVALTAASWNLGIVAFNDGRVFTITNVFIHGVPYMALVWIGGGRARVEAGLRSARRPSPPLIAIVVGFYGLLAALAFAEEALWDRLVWHEHAALFGAGGLDLGALGLALVVAALSVPQATHYVLDRYIWRVGPRNPALAEQLGLASPGPTSTALASRPAASPETRP